MVGTTRELFHTSKIPIFLPIFRLRIPVVHHEYSTRKKNDIVSDKFKLELSTLSKRF